MLKLIAISGVLFIYALGVVAMIINSVECRMIRALLLIICVVIGMVGISVVAPMLYKAGDRNLLSYALYTTAFIMIVYTLTSCQEVTVNLRSDETDALNPIASEKTTLIMQGFIVYMAIGATITLVLLNRYLPASVVQYGAPREVSEAIMLRTTKGLIFLGAMCAWLSVAVLAAKRFIR